MHRRTGCKRGWLLNDWLNKCHFGDCIETMRSMPDGIVQTCVTSPPYFGLRDYGHPGQIGLEETPAAFVAKLVEVFQEVRRVLRDDGTLWLNLGDSYASGKQLIGIPWRVAFALQADGWLLRQDVIWAKPNPMPESVTDRCTKSHEYIFLLAKSERYYYDRDAVQELSTDGNSSRLQAAIKAGSTKGRRTRSSVYEESPANNHWMFNGVPGVGTTLGSDTPGLRNKRSVWTVATTPYSGAHFATFPTALIEPCILAGAPGGGVVLDPFFGSGTTGQVAQNLGRAFIGCELNPAYEALQAERLRQMGLILEAA